MNKQGRLSLTRSAVYMIIGQAAVLMGVCLLVAGVFFYRSMMPVYESMNYQICNAARGIVDETQMRGILARTDQIVKAAEDPKRDFYADKDAWLAQFEEIRTSEGYKSQWNSLTALRHGMGVAYISFVLVYPEQDFNLYVMDSGSLDEWQCGMIDEKELEEYAGSPGMPYRGYVYKSPEYGVVRLDGIPYYTDETRGINAYILTVTPLESLQERTVNFLFQTAILTAIVTIIICFGVTVVLKKRIVRPLQDITDTAERFVSEYETRYDTHEETHAFDGIDPGEIAELHELTSSLRSMELEMNTYLKDIDHLATERTRISTELDFATRIQAAMLPDTFPPYPERPEIDLYATMNPAKEVGGDFYDLFLADEDHLCLVMADVSGKGIPAALFMMVAKSLIKSCMRGGASPAEALTAVNEQIMESGHNNMFVTVWLCRIDLKTGEGLASNAGHEHPVLKRKGGSFEMIKYRHDPAVGTLEQFSYHEHPFQLFPGDTLFVYTDGLPEASDAAENMFGTARMMETLNAAGDLSPRELLAHMKEAVRSFVGVCEPFDDLTMLAYRPSENVAE